MNPAIFVIILLLLIIGIIKLVERRTGDNLDLEEDYLEEDDLEENDLESYLPEEKDEQEN